MTVKVDDEDDTEEGRSCYDAIKDAECRVKSFLDFTI